MGLMCVEEDIRATNGWISTSTISLKIPYHVFKSSLKNPTRHSITRVITFSTFLSPSRYYSNKSVQGDSSTLIYIQPSIILLLLLLLYSFSYIFLNLFTLLFFSPSSSISLTFLPKLWSYIGQLVVTIDIVREHYFEGIYCNRYG